MPTPLTWVSTPALGQGRASGGNAASELFEGGGSQRRRSLLETLVREICQNSTDQRIGGATAEVCFDLILLRGEERLAFLSAMDWEGLRPHLAAVRGAGGAALTLRAGLAAIEAETLVCLRISDSGTAGLSGDDWDEEGNFRRLCVQNFSTGEEAGRGGSFGLGKAVSWMHSRLLTVLFSSSVQDMEKKGLRVFGRSELPAHELNGENLLDGAYLGVPAERDGIRVALSDWRSTEAAHPLQLDRADLKGSGTTLLIPAFHEPDREDVGILGIREPEELCRDLTDAAAKWFWPAISWGRLAVRSRVLVSGETKARFESWAEVKGHWAPFLAASRVKPDGRPALRPGDSAAIDITGFPLPARIQPEDRPELLHKHQQTLIRVGVTRVSPSEACLPCRSTIAMIRGAGMVVDYAEGLRLHDGGSYCAVALVGSALHHTPASEALEITSGLAADAEEYFRASPVAAARGEKSRLEVRIDREGSSFNPERGGWDVQGELVRHGRADGPATSGLSFRSIADSGQGESWRISGLEINGSRKNLSLDDADGRRFVFSVDSGFSAVPFRCLVSPPAGVNPALTGFRQGG